MGEAKRISARTSALYHCLMQYDDSISEDGIQARKKIAQAYREFDALTKTDPLKADLVEALRECSEMLADATNFLPEGFSMKKERRMYDAVDKARAALARAREGEKHG